MRVKGRMYTEAELWHFASAIFLFEKQGGRVRTGSSWLTVLSYSIMLLCSLSCVECRLADSWMFTGRGWEPQMRDLMKELFQLVFAGNEEKNKKPLSVFRPRPNMTTLGTQVDSVTTTTTRSMLMTLGFLATVNWQEESCFMS